MKSSELINTKFINRTKYRLISTLSNAIIKQCENELYIVFQEYATNNLFNLKDAEMYLKAFNSDQEKQSNKIFILDFYYVSYYQYASNVLKDTIIAEYVTVYFIKEIIKSQNHLYYAITETVSI